MIENEEKKPTAGPDSRIYHTSVQAVPVDPGRGKGVSQEEIAPLSTSTNAELFTDEPGLKAVVDPLQQHPEIVQVIAPSSFSAGSVFEAQFQDEQQRTVKFMVTVPEGGCEEGDAFTVPYPPASEQTIVDDDVPTGRWRTELCACCGATKDDCCLCLMGFCCSSILMAQVMRRMKYNFGGLPATSNGYEYVCIVITAVTLLVTFFGSIFLTSAFGYILFVGWFIYLIVAFTCARRSMRRKYKIEPTTCCADCCSGCCRGSNNPIEDCCCVYWCGCCTAIQMASHTHNGRKYRYNPWNQNGLNMYAPEVV